MHVLLIDDDPRFLETLCQGFTESGHECETYAVAAEGLTRLLDLSVRRPDIVLLDVMMPDVTGWDVIAKLRQSGESVPIIFLSARQEVDDRVHGLELGADDYVVKPFVFKELLARMQAILRRHAAGAPLIVGPLTIHRGRLRVECEGKIIETSAREHTLLETLGSEPGRTFSKKELLDLVWDIQFDPGTNVVEVLVARLRRKLGKTGAKAISTVVREGYRMLPDDQPHPAPQGRPDREGQPGHAGKAVE